MGTQLFNFHRGWGGGGSGGGGSPDKKTLQKTLNKALFEAYLGSLPRPSLPPSPHEMSESVFGGPYRQR